MTNWNTRYATEGDTWSFVGEGGSIYTKRPSGLIVKTLHPIAFEGYKDIRPGMYKDQSQVYKNIAFTHPSAKGPYSWLPQVMHNFQNDASRFMTVGEAKDRMSKLAAHPDTHPRLKQLFTAMSQHPAVNQNNDNQLFVAYHHLSDWHELLNADEHEVPDIIRSLTSQKRPDKPGYINFSYDRVSSVSPFNVIYTPDVGWKVHNWGPTAFGSDESAMEKSKRSVHHGHDVEQVFRTPEEAHDYVMDPTNVARYQEILDRKREWSI